MNTSVKKLTLSVVSHGHLPLIISLIDDLLPRLDFKFIDIILTINIRENEEVLTPYIPHIYKVVRNDIPLGFGENHNNAFRISRADLFLVANPDVRIFRFDITSVESIFHLNSSVGALSPLVYSQDGRLADFARKYPSMMRLSIRLFTRNHSPDYFFSDELTPVDWFAGVFIIFRRDAYQCVGGFDRSYFMYLEDADICLRLQVKKWKCVVFKGGSVVHVGARSSHTRLKYFAWHLSSMIRFLFRINNFFGIFK